MGRMQKIDVTPLIVFALRNYEKDIYYYTHVEYVNIVFNLLTRTERYNITAYSGAKTYRSTTAWV